MRSITLHLTSEFYNNGITAKNVASNNAYDVSTYSELRRIIAKLSYANKDYILFFRGQKNDYYKKNWQIVFLSINIQRRTVKLRRIKIQMG